MKLNWENIGTNALIASFAVLVISHINTNNAFYSEKEKSENPVYSSNEHKGVPMPRNKTAKGPAKKLMVKGQGPYPMTPEEFHVVLPPRSFLLNANGD